MKTTEIKLREVVLGIPHEINVEYAKVLKEVSSRYGIDIVTKVLE